MNKEQFIDIISQELNYNKDRCLTICNILEDYLLIGRKNKKKIIEDLIKKLDIQREEAERIYKVSSKTVTKKIKNKLLNPFGSSK